MNMSSSLGADVGLVGSVGLGVGSGRRRTRAEVKVRVVWRANVRLDARVWHRVHIDDTSVSMRRSDVAVLGCSILVVGLSSTKLQFWTP
jgi:hypothetical protein